MSRPGDALAAIGGGDPAILQRAPSERGRFIQMAWVLFGTAAVALTSMVFALHDGMHAPWPWAALLGVGWSALIFNLDRFLVVSIGITRGLFRLALLAIPRLAMAIVLATVISTPLVLRIFSSAISYELYIMQQQNSAAQINLNNNTTDQQLATQLKGRITADENILSGKVQVPTSDGQIQTDQAQVQSLTGQLTAARQTMLSDLGIWHCELYGPCPDSGPGPVADQKHTIYLTALGNYNQLNTQRQGAQATLQADEAKLGSTQQGYVRQAQAQAQADLPVLQEQYATVEKRIAARIQQGNAANDANNGLPAQIQALFRLGGQNSAIGWTHLAVFLLFFIIEILPVMVKVLLNLAPPTAYAKIAATEEANTVEVDELHAGVELHAERIGAEEDKESADLDSQLRRYYRKRDFEDEKRIDDGKRQVRLDAEANLRQHELDLARQHHDTIAQVASKVIEHLLAAWAARAQAQASAATAQGAGPQPGTPPPATHITVTSTHGLPDEDDIDAP